MPFRTPRPVLGALVILCLALAAWSASLPNESMSPRRSTSENMSTSGKISSIGDAQFSLESVGNQKAYTRQFLIDENTKVEGQLIIGSHATVEYRKEGDKLIANRVTIVPASGFSR